MNGMSVRANLALKDIEKARHDLAEGIEELNFMIGDGAVNHKKMYDDLNMKYREIIEEVGPRDDEDMNDRSYSDIQKMQYLKTLVSGEAEKTIANLEITSENFEKAWKILTARYENKRAIRDTHLELLLKLPNISFDSSSNLREYFDRSRECIELLERSNLTLFAHEKIAK